MEDDSTSVEKIVERREAGSGFSPLSGKQRERLIKRLALFGLPNREIVRISGASSRTVARTLQQMGIRRRRPEVRPFPSPKKRRGRHRMEILLQYYALKEVLLSSIYQLAGESGLPLEKLFGLIRQNVSPSQWAIRSCLACGQPVLTSGPSERFCPACKKRVRQSQRGVEIL